MGFDCDLSVGWAMWDTRRTPSGIVSGSLGKLDGDDPIEVSYQIRKGIVPLLKEYQPALVAIERPQIHGQKFMRKDEKTGQMVEGGTNTRSIATTNWVGGALSALCFAWNIRCIGVWPTTWQTVIPKSIKQSHQGKDRVKATCDLLKITSPNQAARDAALIAFWTVQCSDDFKMIKAGQA